MAFQPAKDVPPGTKLPGSEFPQDLRCPWCPGRKPFKHSNGLRGHASGKHGITWEKTAPLSRERDSLAVSTVEKRKQFPKHMAEDPYRGARSAADLWGWRKVAVFMRELTDATVGEIAEQFGQPDKKVEHLLQSPAADELCVQIRKMVAEDPEIARVVVRGAAANAALDFAMALEWAKDAKDYDAVHRMTKDLLKATGSFEHNPDEESRTIRVVLDTGTLDSPEITTSYEVLEAEVVDD